MSFSLPNEVISIMNKFSEAGYQIYIVGGAVRDLIMEKEIHDWDFTTDAKPEEILKLFPKGFCDNKFGTVGITRLSVLSDQSSDKDQSVIGLTETERQSTDQPTSENREQKTDNHEIFEITTMRKEGKYEDSRHPLEVSWTNKIEEDLSRRDFTINALALGQAIKLSSDQTIQESRNRIVNDAQLLHSLIANNLVLVDPFDGQKDIEQKLIKSVGDPNKRFQEDALRLMRAIRIATQLNFQIEQKTFEAIKTNASLIKNIAYERVRDELFKILSTQNPLEGIELLKKTGLLEIVLPELTRTFGIVQEGPKHDRVYDIGEHSFLSLKHTPSTDPLVRFAALLHDVGKFDTMNTQEDGNVTFYNHDIVGGRIVLEISKRFNLSKKQTDKLYRLVRWHLFTVDENQTDSAIRRFIKNVGVENIDDMFAVRIGDRLGGGTQKAVSWRMEKYQERIKQVLQKPFSITDLKVNGKDVMEILKIAPGRQVGEILQKLFEEVLEDDSKNNREYLLQQIAASAMPPRNDTNN